VAVTVSLKEAQLSRRGRARSVSLKILLSSKSLTAIRIYTDE